MNLDDVLDELRKIETGLVNRNRSARNNRNRAEKAGKRQDAAVHDARAQALAEAGRLVARLRAEVEADVPVPVEGAPEVHP